MIRPDLPGTKNVINGDAEEPGANSLLCKESFLQKSNAPGQYERLGLLQKLQRNMVNAQRLQQQVPLSNKNFVNSFRASIDLRDGDSSRQTNQSNARLSTFLGRNSQLKTWKEQMHRSTRRLSDSNLASRYHIAVLNLSCPMNTTAALSKP